MPITPLGGVIPVLTPIGPQNAESLKLSGLGGKSKFDTMLNNLIKESKLEAKVPHHIPGREKHLEAPTTIVQKIVDQISKSEGQLNDLVKMGITGQNLTNQQLLTMQAGVYKATIAIDVVSKGVEQTTGGIKTLLQSQV